MKTSESRQILDYLKRIDESINGPRQGRPPEGERPLADRMTSVEERLDQLDTKVTALDATVSTLGTKVDKLDDRVSEVQLGLATLAADTKAGFRKVDRQFQDVGQEIRRVDRSIESSRVQLVDLVSRVHDEVMGRVIDLETPGPGGKGGSGRGSGGGGVPLAS